MSGRSDDFREINRSSIITGPQGGSELLVYRTDNRARVTTIEVHADDENWFEVETRDTDGSNRNVLRYLFLESGGFIRLEQSFHDPEFIVGVDREIVVRVRSDSDSGTEYAANIQLFEQDPFTVKQRRRKLTSTENDGDNTTDAELFN